MGFITPTEWVDRYRAPSPAWAGLSSENSFIVLVVTLASDFLWPTQGHSSDFKMSFWQENYGFVKEVYDFRCSKYLEWMDNIEAIIGKVMANTQYTAKEFKIIKDTFTVRNE